MTGPRDSTPARLTPELVTPLVRRAAAGDQAAFTELVRRHRNLVFAVSLAAVGDPHLAEDIAQETFLAAFLSLPRLEDPAAFPAWLRRIARRQCGRALRRRRVPTRPLESAGQPAAEHADPAMQLDCDEARDTMLRALWRIPAGEREVVALYYIEGRSQREIAALLGLPVTTVNNRMHEGRQTLRRELAAAMPGALRRSRLPARFADRVGTILRVHGPVMDVRFAMADLPEVLETIGLRSDSHKRDAILEVVQRRGHGIVRCLATSPERITPGMRAPRSELRAKGNSRDDALAAISALHPRGARGTKILETGIKAIDLLCPIVVGGTVAIVGDAGVGKLVLVQELARRLAARRGGIGVFTFVRLAEQPWARDVAAATEMLASAIDLTFFLAADERDEPNDPDGLPVDTLIRLSRSRAERRIYPAIDPIRSRSRLLAPALAGPRHRGTADAVRGALERLGDDCSGGSEREAGGAVPDARAWKLQLYLSQPLFVAQPFTGVEGEWVPLRDTLAMCREILAGRHDRMAPEAFWFVGGRPRDGRRAPGSR